MLTLTTSFRHCLMACLTSCLAGAALDWQTELTPGAPSWRLALESAVGVVVAMPAIVARMVQAIMDDFMMSSEGLILQTG